MKKVAIIIGHTSENPGAWSEHFQKHEYSFHLDLVPALADTFDIFIHDAHIRSYSDRMRHTAARINEKTQYKIIYALHFNAFNKKAHGAEALYYHTNDYGKDIANNFIMQVHERMNIRPRSAKPLYNPNDRGFWEIASPRDTVVLLEPFFGDNQDDCRLFDKETYVDILKNLV
jgi:N-acetylmuramoyl-L-alanine amidase